jgi:hypothetical protein
MKSKMQCGAHARTTGAPCKAQGLLNGRCKLHGGASTGPKTPEGKRAIALVTKARMFNGQLQVAKTGFQRWLVAGGREQLSRLAKQRWRRSKRLADKT